MGRTVVPQHWLPRGEAVVGSPSTLEVTVATAHQACGAALLAASVLLPLDCGTSSAGH